MTLDNATLIRNCIQVINKTFLQLYLDESLIENDLAMTFFSREPKKYYNSAQPLDPDMVLDSSSLQTIQATYRGRNCQPGVHLVQSWPQEANVKHLKAFGFHLISEEEEAWWILDLNQKFPPEVESDSIKLVPVQSAEQTKMFVEVDQACNDLTSSETEVLYQKLHRRPSWLQPYLISYENQIAGVSLSGFVEDYVGFAEGGVLPEFRGKGLHRFSFLERCRLARQKNIRYAVMNCVASSVSNKTALSTGFSLLFKRSFFQTAD